MYIDADGGVYRFRGEKTEEKVRAFMKGEYKGVDKHPMPGNDKFAIFHGIIQF